MNEELKVLTVDRIREYIQSKGAATEVEVWGQDMVGWLIDEHKRLEADVLNLIRYIKAEEAGDSPEKGKAIEALSDKTRKMLQDDN